MDSIPFWQTSTAGVLAAALLTVISTSLLWWFTRRRDDRIEARRIRRECGVDSIRVAYRLRDACNELLSANDASRRAKVSSEARKEHDRRWDNWQRASHVMGEQLYLAQALASVDVWMALRTLAFLEQEKMLRLLSEGADGGEGAEFQKMMDWLIDRLASAVRDDTRTDLGAKTVSRRERRAQAKVDREISRETKAPPAEPAAA